MSIYDLELLMRQTRKLAAQYRETTGQSLPVTVELARFDAITLLGLKECESTECEAIRETEIAQERIQIKGRVIFPGGKSRQKVGQLNLKAPWDHTVLVVYDTDYLPMAIYQLARPIAEQAMAKVADTKRGAMTVAKFKAMGELLWQNPSSNESMAEGSNSHGSNQDSLGKPLKRKDIASQ